MSIPSSSKYVGYHHHNLFFKQKKTIITNKWVNRMEGCQRNIMLTDWPPATDQFLLYGINRDETILDLSAKRERTLWSNRQKHCSGDVAYVMQVRSLISTNTLAKKKLELTRKISDCPNNCSARVWGSGAAVQSPRTQPRLARLCGYARGSDQNDQGATLDVLRRLSIVRSLYVCGLWQEDNRQEQRAGLHDERRTKARNWRGR